VTSGGKRTEGKENQRGGGTTRYVITKRGRRGGEDERKKRLGSSLKFDGGQVVEKSTVLERAP